LQELTSLTSNDFDLFGLTPLFAQNRPIIDARWKELQRQAHPDKFAAQGASAQRVAMQWSVRINEAYRRLKNPLERASYICEINGSAINAENNTAMPTAFLMQQMEWREALEGAESLHDVEIIESEVSQRRSEMLVEIALTLDEKKDFPAAANQVRSLMFVERFASELASRLEQLGQ
jgi:molecular chaperone HscB